MLHRFQDRRITIADRKNCSANVRHDKDDEAETEAVQKRRVSWRHLSIVEFNCYTIAAMRTIRTFVAIPLTSQSQRTIRLIERVRQPSDGIKWVPTDNLHLTLKFLGEVDNTEVPAVCDVVRDVCADRDPFELHFARTAGFPSIDRPRVLSRESRIRPSVDRNRHRVGSRVRGAGIQTGAA